MDSWYEITRSPEFQELTPENRASVKQRFYQEKVAPFAQQQEGFDSIGHDKMFEWFMQQPDDSGQGMATSLLGSAVRGAGEFIPGSIQGIGALTGIGAAERAGESIRESIEDIAPVNPLYEQGVPAKLANTAGQMGSLLIPAGAGGAVGRGIAASRLPLAATQAQRVAALAKGVNVGAEVASLGSAGLQGAAQGSQLADQYGMEGLDRYANILSNVGAELIPEKIPFGLKSETALARKLFGGTPKAGGFTNDVATNAIEEGVTQFGSNLATQTFAPVGVETPELSEGVIESGLYGGFGGGLLGGVNLATGAYKNPVVKEASVTAATNLNQAAAEGVPVSATAQALNEIEQEDTRSAFDFEENLRKTQEEGAAADIQAAQMRAQEEYAAAQAAAERQAQFDNLTPNESLVETPAGSPILPTGEPEVANLEAANGANEGLGNLGGGILPQESDQAIGSPSPESLVSDAEVVPTVEEPTVVEAPRITELARQAAAIASGAEKGADLGFEKVANLSKPSELPILKTDGKDGSIAEKVQSADVSTALKRLAEDLAFSGVGTIDGVRYAIQASPDGTFYVQKTTDGVREALALGQPDIETANQAALQIASNEYQETSAVGAKEESATQSAKPKSAKSGKQAKASTGGMSVEESKAYLARPGQILGFDEPSFLDSQRQKGKIKPAKPLTPTTETPTPATEGQPMSGDSGSEVRDKTKPEQMTPEEFDEYVKQSGREYYLKHGKNAPMRTGQLNVLQDAIEKKLPVSVAAFDAQVEKGRPIALPAGYVREGDLYVYRSEASPAPASQEAGQAEAKGDLAKAISRGAVIVSEDDKFVITEKKGIRDNNIYFAYAKDSGDELVGGQPFESLAKARAFMGMEPSKAAPPPSRPQGGQPMSGDSGSVVEKQGSDINRTQMRLPQVADATLKATKDKADVKPSIPTLKEYASAMGMPSAADPDAYNHGLIVESYKQAYPNSAIFTQAGQNQTAPTVSPAKTDDEGGTQRKPVGEPSLAVSAIDSLTNENTSSGKVEAGNAALDSIIADLPTVAQAKYTPEVRAKAAKFFETRNEADLNGLTQIQKTKVHEALYRSDKEAEAAQKAADKLYEKKLREEEKENARLEKERAEQEKLTESRRGAYDSIIGTPQGVEMNAVTPADGQESLALVHNSGDVPGVLNAFVGTSKEFLSNPENEANYPELWKILKGGRVDEGNFAYGRAFVFTDGIGVNESDRRNAEKLGITPALAAVRRVLIHESLVHRGIYGLPQRLKLQILQWVKQNASPEQLDDLAKDYPQYENWRNNEMQMLGLCEEFLAKKVEKLTRIPTNGPLARLMDILKDIWRWITGNTSEPTVENLRDVVKLLKAGVEAADARLVNGGGIKMSQLRVQGFVTPEMDAEYMATVESGDVTKQQAMVDGAAKAAGYNVGPVYHGTAPSSWSWDEGLKLFGVFGKDWTAFNGPAYFASNKTYADAFAKHRSGERSLGNEPITLSVMLSGKFKDMRGTDGFWKELRSNPKTLIASASSEGFTGFLLTEADTSKRPEWAGDIYFVFDPNQIKSADPVTRDESGNVIPLSQRFNERSNNIRYSRIQYASPLESQLAQAAERMRAMREKQVPQEVDAQTIRNEIRNAYDRAIIGDGSIQASLQKVFDEAKTQLPTLTERQFGEQVQALYEDGSAFLVPTDRSADMLAAGEKWGVYDVAGLPASYVGVLPSEVKASVATGGRKKADISPEIREQVKLIGSNEELALNRHRALKALREAQPKFHIKQDDEPIVAVAINIVDALKASGVKPQELNNYLTDPEFLDDLGIPIDSSLYQALAMEIYNQQQEEVTRLEKAGNAGAANKLRKYVSAMQKQWYESGTRAGQRLNIRLQLINNPRYQGLFLATHLNEAMRENAQAKAEAQTEIKADDVAKTDETAKAEAADEVAAEIEELEMAELDRLGEEQLDDAERPLWQQIKGYITRLGAIAYARLQKAAGNIKASNAAESASDMVRRYISMPDKEIDAEEADIHQKLKAAMKKFMGKGTEKQKKVKKDLIDRTTEIAKKPRAKRTPKVETPEQKAKREQAKKAKADSTAGRIIYRTEELFRQGFKNDIRSGQDKPSIYKEFIQQIKEPTDLASFAARLAKLKVSQDVAERMFRTAALEKTDREAVANERDRIRNQELREKQAMNLVYLTEQNMRQSGAKGIQDRSASENDSVRKAFKDQINAGTEDAALKQPLSKEAFLKRLADLKVGAPVAEMLYKTAERERADLEASAKYDLLESPWALREMMRKLSELRFAENTPFTKPIPWKKLLSLSKGTQEQRRSEMEAAIRDDETLKNLDVADQKKLADLIESAWEAQRQKVFKTEIDRLTRLKKTSPKAKEALEGATQKLLEMINLGVLDNDELYSLIAEKFGFVPLTSEQKSEIEDIAQKLQGDLPPYRRTQLVSKFKDIITKTADVPFAQKAADWWVTAVLTGPRTAFTIGLGFLSGGYQVISNAVSLVAMNSGDINAWKSAGAAINDWVASMPRNAGNALGYLWDGREDRLDPTMSNISSWLNLDKKSLTQTDTAAVLLQSKNPISRLAGGFMTFFKRLLVALDMFNAASAKDGSLALSYYQTRQSQDAPFSLAELSSLRDFKAARNQVLAMEFGNKEPTSLVEKTLLDAWATQYLWQKIAKFEGIVENATYNAQQGAMSLDPSGIGGQLYHAILSTQSRQKELSSQFLKSAQQSMLQADSFEAKAVAKTKLALAYFYQFAAYNMLGAVGLKFARYAGNRLNQTISFVPVLGAFRLHETEGVPREMHRSQIIANQSVGSLVAIFALVLMKEMSDEPDEEKRGWGWEGPWDALTPERKSQRMSAGKQAYTLTIGGKTFKYQNWPMGGVLAAVGSLMDMIQYSPDKWNEKTIPGKVSSAGLAALLSVSDSASLSQFSQMFGRSVQTRDPLDAATNTLSKTAASYAGGFIPRIFKDVDAMFSPEINRYKTPFEFMAREVPIYRSSVGTPMLDIFAAPVAPARDPTSREFIAQPTEPEYRQIGRLNERGIWLTSANPENRLIGKGSKKRHMTDEEGLRYIKATGNAYRDFVLRYTDRILAMPKERARQFVLDKADEIRDRAAKQSIRKTL